jgi:hypothetical protein
MLWIFLLAKAYRFTIMQTSKYDVNLKIEMEMKMNENIQSSNNEYECKFGKKNGIKLKCLEIS